jgi:hypothetical protein
MSAVDILPGRTCPDRLTTKEAAPASVSQGLFVDGCRQMVFNPAASHKIFNQQKKRTYTHIQKWEIRNACCIQQISDCLGCAHDARRVE